jgi:hypothetical protein
MNFSFVDFIDLVTGKAGALVLSVTVLYMVYKGIEKIIVWFASNLKIWVERHLEQIDQIIAESKEDRKIYHESMIRILKQFDIIEDRIIDHGQKLERIEKKINESSLQK